MTYKGFGNLLKIEREKRGWDQLALAKAVGTKQQTVSRWESGASRPREDMVHQLAELFEAEAEDWLVLAGYQLEKPVRPQIPFLPLDKLSPENFELFCKDLVQKLHPKANVHRYGRQGHKQHGIDLYAKEAGKKTDYQCKRHVQFGPEDVRQVVKDTALAAEHHHLLLSRQASPGARDAVDEFDDWSLWDAEDISAKVRYLPKQDALDLVDTYFPDWRKHFLGLEAPSPWLTADKYFQPLNDRLRVFSHGWNFFGRKKELESLVGFAKQSDERAIMLIGRGGVGKSRLLKELAAGLEKETKVLFMTQRSEPTPADLEILPQKGLLVIDDAHEYGDLQALLSGIATTRPYLKLLISTRPYGVTMMEDQLTRAGIGYKHEDGVSLGNMQMEDAENLAMEILRGNSGDEQYAHRIAEITLDCPLATVIGARLVADGDIKPEILANSDSFRTHLLRSFRDIVTGQIGGLKDAETIKDLLDLIAVLQPVDTTDPVFEETATKILKRPYDKVIRDMRALEDAGVLLRRKNRLRIAPDLLADFIRADAAYDQSGKKPTGYVERIFKAVRNDLATNLLVNLSQLDWRLSADGTQAALLAPVWKDLERQFIDGDISVRQTMLKALEKVAYYQPAQAITFARLAIDNPTDRVKKTEHDHWFRTRPSYGTVLAEVSPLLKYAAYNSEYLIEALDLLKKLAQEDKRQPSQYPDHPVRILQDIAAIQPGKPLEYIEAAINHVREWLKDDYNETFSPFDILDQALITEGHQTEFKGIQLTMKPFKVRADVVEGMRNSVIDTAFTVVQAGSLPEAARAMKTIEEALRGPFGADVSPDDEANWGPGQLAILKRLEKLVAMPGLDPFIAVEARGAVNWHATYSKTATKPSALAVLKAIPKTTEHDLARALADGWGWTFERSATDYQRDEATFIEWRKKFAKHLIQEYEEDHGSLIEKLEERITTLDSLQIPRGGDSGPFIYTLVSESEAFGDLLGQYIVSRPDSSLAIAIGVVVNALANLNYEKAVVLAEQGLKTGDEFIERRLAHSIGWGMNHIAITELEMPLIQPLMASKDKIVRQNIVRVVKRFSDDQKQRALDLLMGMPFADDKHLAGEVLGEFGKDHGSFKVEELKPQQLDHIHAQLLQIDSLDEHHISQFVGELSYYQPDRAVQLLFDRVESKRNQDEKSFGYYPVPLGWGHGPGLRFSETSSYERILQKVRNWTNAEPDNWYRHQYGPEIFKSVSAGHDEVTLRAINEWIMSPNARQIETAANLLSEFPSSFIWSNSPLIITLLERAQQHGEECYRRVSSSLHGAAIQGSRTGTPGQPFREDIYQRDTSLKMMKELPTTSPSYKFYKSLHAIAVDNIKRDTIDEEDLFEDG